MASKYERTASLVQAWHEVWGSSETIGIVDDIVHILRILHQDEKSNATREQTAEGIVDYLNDAFTMDSISFDEEPVKRSDRQATVRAELAARATDDAPEDAGDARVSFMLTEPNGGTSA